MENHKSYTASHVPDQGQAAEISLSQVLDFLIGIRKPLALGLVGGLVLGLAGAMTFGAHKSEVVLDNSNKVIDFSTWRVLESRLPSVAARALERKLVKPEEIEQYKRLAESERTPGGSWLKKNVSPTFSLSKSDFKNFAAMSKESQDTAGVLILNLVVNNSDNSRENGEKNLKLTADFIQTGSAYIELKALLDSYEQSVKTIGAQNKSKLSAVEIEILYAEKKASNLEKLRIRFPSNASFGSNQIIDPKDSGAKYLPISTQLVAVNSDLNNLNENIVRLVDQQAKQKILRDFLDRVNPIFATSLNGLVLSEQLLAVEAELRKTLDPQNIKQQNALDGIHSDIASIQTRFVTFMDRSEITTTRSGVALPGVLGAMAGGFLALLLLLGQRFLQSIKMKPSLPLAAEVV